MSSPNNKPSNAPLVAVPLNPPLPEVSLAYLHQPTTFTGCFTSATTLSKQAQPELDIRLVPEGLLLTHKGTKAIIPWSAVKLASLK